MNYTKVFSCGCTMTVLNSGEGSICYCSKHKAAPDMYRAITQLLDRMEREYEMYNRGDFTFHKDSSMANTLKLARAKAEGRDNGKE